MEIVYNDEQYLAHHGIKGQKWGVRRYQNPDGTLTDAGLKRYNKQKAKIEKSYGPNTFFKVNQRVGEATTYRRIANNASSRANVIKEKYGEDSEKYKKAKYNAKKSEAIARRSEAIVSKMKETELKNLDDATFDSNMRKNVGKAAAKTALLSVAGLALAATTGVGFYAIPLGGATSITKEQMDNINAYAQSIYEKTMAE